MMCRKRYIDEKLIESLNQIDAVVNLGAEFDTRAYWLPALADTPVWELDQSETIKQKQTQLRKVFGTTPWHVKLVAIDFDREDLASVLESQGYSTDKRTFFIWEAVTQYLTEKGLRTTFDFLSKAARGSRLIFTYVRKDFLEGRAMHNWEKGFKKYVTSKITRDTARGDILPFVRIRYIPANLSLGASLQRGFSRSAQASLEQ